MPFVLPSLKTNDQLRSAMEPKKRGEGGERDNREITERKRERAREREKERWGIRKRH